MELKCDDAAFRVHGPTSQCPHPRVLPNLISAALAAIQSVFDPALARSRGDDSTLPSYVDYLSSADLSLIGDADDSPCDSPARRVDRKRLECYCVVLDAMYATVYSCFFPPPNATPCQYLEASSMIGGRRSRR